MPNKSFSRAARKVHIHQYFINRYKNGKREEVTSAQVARSLMLEPSTHIRGLLAEMVKDGALSSRVTPNPHAKNLVVNRDGKQTQGDNDFVVWYQLSEREIAEIDKASREINVKLNGRLVTQIKLF